MLTEYPIHVDQLAIGLYVRVEAGDGGNPFHGKAFKIEKTGQIEALKSSGLTHLICVLNKSDRMPLPLVPAGAAPAQAAPPKTPVYREIAGIRQEAFERNLELKKRFERVGKKYQETVGAVGAMLSRMSANTGKTMAEAEQVVASLMDVFLSEREVTVGLITGKGAGEERSSHAFNVSILTMILGRETRLPAPLMRVLGLAALFHDVGMGRVPLGMVDRATPQGLKLAEKKLYRGHPQTGARLLSSYPEYPPLARETVLMHHEHLDGSGFPSGLSGEAILAPARMLAIANTFDNLVNPRENATRHTPHEAMQQLYRRRARLDEAMLGAFIRNLGVYPPGTVVELSNAFVGMVVAVGTADSTRPSVLLYHPEVPRKEAVILDLSLEDEVKVVKSIRPEALPADVLAYLAPEARLNFFADAAPAA